MQGEEQVPEGAEGEGEGEGEWGFRPGVPLRDCPPRRFWAVPPFQPSSLDNLRPAQMHKETPACE